MFGILARLLELLYSWWPSYGGSIILFTVAIMLVLAPLTFKSTRSMLAMQALQPEMKKLQNRYKDDRQKLNEEMMKFYQENKISPLGGCLPMLLQIPVFFILYAVLLGLTKRGPFGGDLGHSVACTMNGINACTDVGTYANAGFFHPAYLEQTSKLYQNLSATRVMDSFGLDLSQSAWGIFPRGIVEAIPYVLMVLVVMGLTYLQQQQIQSRQPNKSEQNPTQQMMMKVMPVAMGFIYIIIPAGVVIYFLVSSLFRIGQQAMVTRTFYTGPNAIVIPATATDVDDGPKDKKRFLDQFKPSEGALPQVGKQAKVQREQAFKKDDAAGSKKGSSTGTKSKPGTKSKFGGKSAGGTSAKTSSAKAGNDANSPKSKKRPSQASAGTTGGRSTGDGRSETTRPSRKAPSRRAPEGPSDSNKPGR